MIFQGGLWVLATVVVASGMFEAGEIGIRFASIAGLGVAIGVAVGLGAAWLNCRARGTEILVTLSLLAPYVAYFVAETVGASGVLRSSSRGSSRPGGNT